MFLSQLIRIRKFGMIKKISMFYVSPGSLCNNRVRDYPVIIFHDEAAICFKCPAKTLGSKGKLITLHGKNMHFRGYH